MAHIKVPPLKRANMLTKEDRMGRPNIRTESFKPLGLMMTSMQPAITSGGCGQKTMRSALEVVEDLKNRYIDLPEYKRGCLSLKVFEEQFEKDLNMTLCDSIEKTEPSLAISKEHLIIESFTMETPSKMIAITANDASEEASSNYDHPGVTSPTSPST